MKSKAEILEKAKRMSLGADTEHGFSLDDIDSGMALAICALQSSRDNVERELREAFQAHSRGDVDAAADKVESACRADGETLKRLYPVLQRMRA